MMLYQDAKHHFIVRRRLQARFEQAHFFVNGFANKKKSDGAASIPRKMNPSGNCPTSRCGLSVMYPADPYTEDLRSRPVWPDPQMHEQLLKSLRYAHRYRLNLICR